MTPNCPSPCTKSTSIRSKGLTLHGSGSTVDTGTNGPGFTSILLRPELGYSWGAIQFMLDSMLKDQPQGSAGLKFTATDNANVEWVFNANFPWEGDKGENQHYHFHALNGESIYSLRIGYNDPNGVNRINAFHNIDVNTVSAVPEPPSLALLSLAVLPSLRRLRRSRS